jgi:HEAT repeat-containing protein 5
MVILLVLQKDLVNLAFNGATSAINALRPVGISVLKDLIECFASTMDPDYEDHYLLEIYSAQIAAALRPAFDKDAPPSLTAAACVVVVLFVSRNLTTDTVYVSQG